MLLLSIPFYAVSSDSATDKEKPATETAEQKVPDEKSADKKAEDETAAKTTLLDIQITGIEDDLLKNAKAYLEIEAKKDMPNLSEAWIQHLHKQAVEEIQHSLEPFGYYNVLVDSSLEQDEKGTWVAAYAVKPGTQTKITKIDIVWLGGGAEEPELQKMIAEIPLKTGAAVLHSDFDKAKGMLLQKALDIGYVDATAEESQLIVYPKKNTAEVKLHIQTGEKYFLGEISLHQDVLNPDLTMRYLDGVETGDPYSQDQLLEIQRDFIEAGFFGQVDVQPDFEHLVDQHVPVDVTMTPAKRQKYSFGLGYDTDIGVNLNARWQHRRLNKAGHQADILIKLSLKESRIQGNYWVPVQNPKINRVGYMAKYEYELTDSTERSTVDLETGYYYKWRDWISKAFTEFKHETFTIGNDPEKTINLVSIGASVDRTAFEKAIYPRRGWQLYTELRGSPGLIFENSAYLRTHIKSKVYLPILPGGRLILRGEFGTAKVDDFELYPASLRFFAGGDNSVRGYEWKSLGPEDDFGEVIGGSHVITGTFEYNYQVAESWLAAGFIDAGNAFDNEFDKVYIGAGIGARWLSPVGIVRVDLAWPQEEEVGNHTTSMRLHIGFEVNL